MLHAVALFSVPVMVSVELPPAQIGVVAATVGTVGLVHDEQLNVHAIGRVKAVASLTVQFAELKIAVLRFVGDSADTTQL